MFRTQRDAEITVGIYKRIPILWRDEPEENPWALSFMSMFHMANDSGLFQTQDRLEDDGWDLSGNVFVCDDKRVLPLYEAKLIHHFDHRLACYSRRPEGSRDTELPRLDLGEKDDPTRSVIPRYWVQEFDAIDPERSTRDKPVYDLGVASRLRARHWDRGWLLGWRDICRSTDERTMICAIIPRSATGGIPLAFTWEGAELLVSAWSTFMFDYITRQKVAGTHITQFVLKQVPTLSPRVYQEPVAWLHQYSLAEWIRHLVLELCFTTWDMESFARDLGDRGAPFHWDEERRLTLRAELDAAYFHLYGVVRGDVDYIMETFPIVRRKDMGRYGEFRTKRLILERYDAMAEAVRTGVAYQTVLDPPPGQGPRHPARSA